MHPFCHSSRVYRDVGAHRGRAVTVRTVASLSDIGDSCVTVSCVSTPMTVAHRAGARWGESSRPSAPLSARAKHKPARLWTSPKESNSPLRGLRVPGRSGRVRTSPLKHLPRTTVAPVAPARPVAVPPTRSAPTPPVASAAVRIATNSRDRAGVGLSFELARRSGHADAPAVAACGACSVGPRRARAGRTGARPPARSAPTPRGPRGTRARAAVARTHDRRPPLLAIRASAAMITKRLWRRGSKQHAASGGAAVECASASRPRGATRRYDVL